MGNGTLATKPGTYVSSGYLPFIPISRLGARADPSHLHALPMGAPGQGRLRSPSLRSDQEMMKQVPHASCALVWCDARRQPQPRP